MSNQTPSNESNFLADMLHYDAWANGQVLKAAVDEPNVLRLLGHLAQAKRIWLLRVQGTETAQMDLWPRLTLEALRQSLPQTDGRWIAHLATESPQRLVQYRNQTGKTFVTPVKDIVIHAANHGTYHRGQLASAVKNAGGMPAVTDYIAWCRLGRPSPALPRE